MIVVIGEVLLCVSLFIVCQKDLIQKHQLETEKMSKLITLFLKDRNMSANQIRQIRFSFEEQDFVLMLQEAMETVKPLAIQNNTTCSVTLTISLV